MISKVEGASSSKKIQRGLVAFVVLLLAAALFVGAGAAADTVWTKTITNGDVPTAIPWDSINLPAISADDKVKVVVEFNGTPASSSLITLDLSDNGELPASIYLKDVTGKITASNCTLTVYKNNAEWKKLDATTQEVTMTAGPSSETVTDATAFKGTVLPVSGKEIEATIEITGFAAQAMDAAAFKTYVNGVYTDIKGAVNDGDIFSGTITVTYTPVEKKDKKDNDEEETPGSTILPTESETIEIPEDGEVVFTVEGLATGGVSLGEGVEGTVTVAALPADLDVPEEWNVLGGAEITTTVVLKDGEIATVSMGIPLTALPEGANPADVVMMHFLAATQIWEELKTTFVIEGDNIIYAGETGSFSPFVLVEKVGGSDPVTPPTEEPTTEPTEEPTETPASPGFGILAALAGLGAVAVLRRK